MITPESLKQAIDESGLTQSGFAQHIGISRSTLNQLLSGERKFTQIHKALFHWYFKANKIRTW